VSNRIVASVAGVALALGIVVGAAGAIVVQDRTTPGTANMNGMPAGMGGSMMGGSMMGGSMMGAGMGAGMGGSMMGAGMHDRYRGSDR
jgi:hypothetical protein